MNRRRFLRVLSGAMAGVALGFYTSFRFYEESRVDAELLARAMQASLQALREPLVMARLVNREYGALAGEA